MHRCRAISLYSDLDVLDLAQAALAWGLLLLLDVECEGLLLSAGNIIRLQHLRRNLGFFIRVLNLRGCQLFYLGPYVFKVIIASNRVNKLSACESSKEEGRLVFRVTGERRLGRSACLLTYKALKLFELLDLPLELAACLRGY